MQQLYIQFEKMRNDVEHLNSSQQVHKIECIHTFKSSQLNAQRSNFNNFDNVEFHSTHSTIYVIETL